MNRYAFVRPLQILWLLAAVATLACGAWQATCFADDADDLVAPERLVALEELLRALLRLDRRLGRGLRHGAGG